MVSSTIKINILISVLIAVLSCSSALAATYDVTTYGAVGTGNEADAAANVTAFANAVAAAGTGGDTVLVPAGIYYIDGQINPGKDNLILSGVGATIKRVTAGPAVMSMISVSTSTGVVIQGLTVDGNRSSMTSSVSFGIRNDYAIALTIKDCNVINCESDGIYLANEVAGTTVDNCTITNNNRQGMAITDSAGYCVIKNCSFNGNASNGLDIEPNWRHTPGHKVINCTFDGGDLQLFSASTYGAGDEWFPWDITIEDCNFINGAELLSIAAMDVTATNNTFTGGGAIRVNARTAATTYGYGAISLTNNSVAGIVNNGINLLSNAGFESWTGGTPNSWTASGTGTYTIESSGPRALEGTMSTHLSGASGNAELKQTISVTAGNYYTFGGYISRDAISGSAVPAITIEFLDSGSSVLKTIYLRTFYEYLKYALYEKIMGIVAAPAGSVSARVTVGAESSGTFDAYFDGLFFYEGVGPDGGDLTAAGEQVLRFDFGPGGIYRPHADYIGVDPNTTYAFDANTGLTYGVFSSHSWDVITGDFKGSSAGWSRFSASDLTLTKLNFPDESPWGVAGFEVELPNGTYYVTIGGGNVGWDLKARMWVEGNSYRGDNDSNENLYILDVAPDKPGGVGDGFLNWNLSSNLVKNGPMFSGRVQMWGANNPHPATADYAEVLYLKDQIVEVADGKLTVYGADTGVIGLGSAFQLNFLEVVKMPILDCNSVWSAGFGLSYDINKDCGVDALDLAYIVNDWADCFDPADPSCPLPW